ncbi:AmmeMemoRadiSam system protein B [Fontisphaera persica]|uniref:AmmeMemoRadiSam system protein B n=1 Tax=Fontisphaera persica TaxID=2974023 RepID=UPI0024BFE010|nr:AmmeMemoRadiSam system protein B [Fontisphaera persica]WCJ58645.1 AmmeMemoRadiSam system protein B [Fontisphaera persica]
MKNHPVFNPQAVREPAVAGMFYPGQRHALEQEVQQHLNAGVEVSAPAPKAVIAPHAGYLYSGPIAGSAFKPWRAWRGKIQRVVLIGPSHHCYFQGLALSPHGQWDTPAGRFTVDAAAIEQLARLPGVHFSAEAHREEHALEVELAFLHATLGPVPIVPILTGEVDDDTVAEALGTVWGGPETLIVVSSDLSHYYDYRTAQKLDRATADAIEDLAPGEIHPPQACGRLAIQGLLQVAADQKLTPLTVDLRNSGDTAGRKDRVVGYGAFAFCPPPPTNHPTPPA